MTTQIATTQGQSARLLKCGVLADTADMSIRTIVEPYMCEDVAWHIPKLLTLPYSDSKDIYRGDEVVPAWSLSRLLELLPSVVFDDDSNGFYLSLAQEFPNCDDYNAAYKPCWDDGDELVEGSAPCPIEACVRLAESLTSKGYKLKGGSDD